MSVEITANTSLDAPRDDKAAEMEDPNRRLYCDLWYDLEHVEDVENYRPGGLHPVDIGDWILGDRFEVFHKLGSGGFATAWLCYEPAVKKWKAIKINRADASQEDSSEFRIIKLLQNAGDPSSLMRDHHIATPLETFYIEGPNGRHLCTVMPIMGPTLREWRDNHLKLRFDAKSINKVCYQLTKGLGFMHDHEICHGDFQPANVLMQLKDDGLDGLVPEDFCDLITFPPTERIFRLPTKEERQRAEEERQRAEEESKDPDEDREEDRDDKEQPVEDEDDDYGRSPHAPKYLVQPLNWDELNNLISDNVAIVDFGEAFETSHPPKTLGIPDCYAAPEIVFGDDSVPLGIGCDLWSLASIIYFTRTGGFYYTGGIQTWYYALMWMERLAGAIPAPYRRHAAEAYHEMKMKEYECSLPPKVPLEEDSFAAAFNASLDFGPLEELAPVEKPPSLSEMIQADGGTLKKLTDEETDLSRIEEIEKWLSGDLEASDEMYKDEALEEFDSDDDRCNASPDDGHKDIRESGDAETSALADLLSKLFLYQPSERSSVAEILKHPWFQESRERMTAVTAVNEKRLPEPKSEKGQLIRGPVELWKRVKKLLLANPTRVSRYFWFSAVTVLFIGFTKQLLFPPF
ncbi:kinase-like domain-containing protein [Astrocystis sublimbata]|nr:kinase-like domain-containing protein [Astrocystis sublimbata]